MLHPSEYREIVQSVCAYSLWSHSHLPSPGLHHSSWCSSLANSPELELELEPARLACLAAYPQPQYRWIKDGRYLNEFSPENYYRILEVQRSDAGLYQCVAKNPVGAIVSNHINVTVACKY